MSISIEDVSIIEAIQAGGAVRQKALNQFIYHQKVLAEAMRYLQTQGGQSFDMEDAIQEAFLIFDRNIRYNTFRRQSSLKTYFISIVKWQWVNRKRKMSKEVLTEAHEENIHDLSTQYLLASTEKTLVLAGLVQRLGDRCKQMLTLFQTSHSMKEIADIMQFRGEQVANNEVSKCRKRLRETIEKDPTLLEFFNIS